MCHFISWIEYKDEILFLSDDELATKRGKELKKYLGDQYKNDVIGHGAIEWFYKLKKGQGVHKECTNFSTPKNFPNIIVKALKNGKFRSFEPVKMLLSKPALAEYEKIKGPALAEYKKIKGQALAEYEKIEGPAWAEYKKIEGPALAEYKKIKGQAWAEYKKIKGQAWAEYEKINGQALAEYEKIKGQALAEYEKIEGPALAEYEKIKGQAFWKLFKKKSNRSRYWK